jgi:transposase
MPLLPLGIDISKQKFDVALLRDTGKFRHRVFPNSEVGFSQLSARLIKQKVERVHACLEATGAYSEPLATYLREQGQVVSVINPAQIKSYAASHLSRARTDKADATLIARFCSERHPPAWSPLPREARDLQALVRRLDSLLEMRQMEENRLGVAAAAPVKESLSQHIAFLDEEVSGTEALIRSHIDSHPGLRGQRQLLISIPGIGETTAAKIPGEIMDVKLYESARQLAAFAGLAPACTSPAAV